MADVDTRIRVDNSDAARGVAQFKKDLNTIPGAAQRATRTATGSIRRGVDRQFDAMRRNARDLRTLLTEFAIGFGLGSVVRQLFEVNNALVSATNALGAFTASAKATRAELDVVQGTSQKLGLDMLVLTEQWTKMRAATEQSTLSTRGVWEVFEGLSGAARVLNLDAQRTEGVFRAIIQMFSKGKVQAEELRGQLGEHIPGAFQLAAKAMNVSTKELDKLIADGKVLADDLVPALAEEMTKTFGRALPDAVQTSQSELERLKNDIKIFARENQSVIEASFKAVIQWPRLIIQSWGDVIAYFSNVFIRIMPVVDTVFSFIGTAAKRAFSAIIQFFITPLRNALESLSQNDSSFIPDSLKEKAGSYAETLRDVFGEADDVKFKSFDQLLTEAQARFNAVDGQLNIWRQKLIQKSSPGITLAQLVDETFGKKEEVKSLAGLTEDQLKKINQLERGLDGLIRINARFKKMREDIMSATTSPAGDGLVIQKILLDNMERMYQEDVSNFTKAQIQKRDQFNQIMGDVRSSLQAGLVSDFEDVKILQANNIISEAEALAARQRLMNIFQIDSNSFLRGMRQELDLLGESIDNIGQSLAENLGTIGGQAVNDIADAFGRAIAFGEDFSDAINQIGRSIVAEILSALVKMGIQMALNYVLGQTLQRASIASTGVAASSIAAQWATPAYLASVATFGGAAAAGTAALASGLAASNAIAIATQGALTAAGSVGAGKAFGGPVNAGTSYPVNERGIPELFKTRNGNQFLLPTENGVVEPLRRASQTNQANYGGANITVNVIGASSTPEIKQRNGSSGLEIDLIFEQIDKKMASGLISGESKLSTAIERTYGTQRNRGRV